MTRKIFKYPLDVTYEQAITLPVGYELLHVDVQREKPMLWALVNEDAKQHQRVIIKCYGTGQELADDLDYLRHIGSILQYNDTAVWHFFEDMAQKTIEIPKED